MTEPTKVEGVDYSPEGIEQLRQDLAIMRDQTFGHWPDTIPETLILSHAIALLAYLRELLEQ